MCHRGVQVGLERGETTFWAAGGDSIRSKGLIPALKVECVSGVWKFEQVSVI